MGEMGQTQVTDIQLIDRAADLIVKYGFLGVGLVLMIVITPLIYGIWKSKTLAAVTFSFGLAFLVCFGVLDIVQRNFPWLISSKRVLLNGIILKVPNGYQIQVASDLRRPGSAYIKHENDADDRNFNSFPFLLLSSQLPNCLSLAINNNDPQTETGTSAFKITPISADDLKNEAAIVAMAQSRPDKKFELRVWREVGDQQIGDALTLTPLDDKTPGCAIGQDAHSFNWFMPSAFAQSAQQVEDYSARLKSDDLFTRRDARIELSKQGQSSVEMTRQFLNSNNYRLQLGALVALSLMSEGDRKNLPPDVLAKVREFTTHSDATIRETASRIVDFQ
jgi:hypothetical protein